MAVCCAQIRDSTKGISMRSAGRPKLRRGNFTYFLFNKRRIYCVLSHILFI